MEVYALSGPTAADEPENNNNNGNDQQDMNKIT